MTYTVLIASDELKQFGLTHVVAFTDGRKIVGAFTNNDLASKFSDLLNSPVREPQSVTIEVSNSLTLQEKIEVAQKAAAES